MSRVRIVMYHYVRDLGNSRYPEIKGLEYSLFKEQIRFFANHFYVITMEQLIDFYEKGTELPEDALLLTFDDGYIDDYLYVLPVLNEFHMQGSFFVPGKVIKEHCLLDVNKIHFLLASTSIHILLKELFEQLDFYRGSEWNYASNEELFHDYAAANRFDNKETIFFKRILQTVLPEKLRNRISSDMFKKFVGISECTMAHELYLNYDQMKEMKRQGMFFGIHGYDHYWMNCLDEKLLEKDIEDALVVMNGLADCKKWVINYPYGSYSDKVIECVRKKGCVLGLSTDVGNAFLSEENRYKLPRLDTNDYPPKSCNYMKF